MSENAGKGRRRSTGANTALIALGLLVLLAAAALLVFQLLQPSGGDEPEPTETPTSTETPDPTETPEPTTTPTETEEPGQAEFTSFSPADGSASGCTDTVGTQPVTFTWTSTGAVKAYIGSNTDNAKESPYASDLPASGSYDGLSYQCGFGSERFTVTLEAADGSLTHKTVTLTN